jgi:hypothetical protein
MMMIISHLVFGPALPCKSGIDSERALTLKLVCSEVIKKAKPEKDLKTEIYLFSSRLTCEFG